MGLCGDDCKGYYFSTHYAAAGAKGETKALSTNTPPNTAKPPTMSPP
jgi:hypothetical protein